MNLVVNARDAMGDNGIVTIRTRNTVLNESDARRFPFQMAAGPYVTLAVEDNGEGIPKPIRDRIFEPFFTTKEVGKGTGLGLSTVYGIIKQSGGFIWVDSEVGVGSTFTVYLPQAEGQTRKKSTAEVGEVHHGSETILVVEDDEAIRRIIVRTLERWGYEVLAARDGVEGLEMIRSERSVELVIADLVMPRMGGREMVQTAVSEGWEGNVLFVSGYAADRDTRDSLSGAGELLQKPFAPRDLALRIRTLLDRARRD
jgi:CheY-like chemotaxis protein